MNDIWLCVVLLQQSVVSLMSRFVEMLYDDDDDDDDDYCTCIMRQKNMHSMLVAQGRRNIKINK